MTLTGGHTREARGLSRLCDAASLVTVVLTAMVSRRPVRALGDEATRRLPGDEIVPDSAGQWTNGVTIRRPSRDVWPWLVQMGCTRAGWYSYDGLDNGGVPSAERVIPELQTVEVGDVFPWTPTDRDGFVVRAVVPGRALVLGGTPAPFRMTWAFVLEEIDEHTTRLITRCRAVPRNVLIALLLRFAWHPLHFAMQRRQLLNLKRHAEASSAGRSAVLA